MEEGQGPVKGCIVDVRAGGLIRCTFPLPTLLLVEGSHPHQQQCCCLHSVAWKHVLLVVWPLVVGGPKDA
jgi:hypothetical protein